MASVTPILYMGENYSLFLFFRSYVFQLGTPIGVPNGILDGAPAVAARFSRHWKLCSAAINHRTTAV